VAGAATVVLFVLDPTGSCGYPLEEQEKLLARWKEEFPKLPFIEVETKSDLDPGRTSGRLQVSAKSGEGLADLMQRVEEALGGRRPPSAPVSREEEWPVWPVEAAGGPDSNS
jgi:nucleolar GTP-binding protein